MCKEKEEEEDRDYEMCLRRERKGEQRERSGREGKRVGSDITKNVCDGVG